MNQRPPEDGYPDAFRSLPSHLQTTAIYDKLRARDALNLLPALGLLAQSKDFELTESIIDQMLPHYLPTLPVVESIQTWLHLPQELKTTRTLTSAIISPNMIQIVDQFYRLPFDLQTSENVSTLTLMQGHLHAGTLLDQYSYTARPYLANLGLNNRAQYSNFVFDKWNKLPERLKTQDNFTLYFTSDPVWLLIKAHAFDQLPELLKTQRNMDRLFTIANDMMTMDIVLKNPINFGLLTQKMLDKYLESIRQSRIDNRTHAMILKLMSKLGQHFQIDHYFDEWIALKNKSKLEILYFFITNLHLDPSIIELKHLNAILGMNKPDIYKWRIERITTSAIHFSVLDRNIMLLLFGESINAEEVSVYDRATLAIHDRLHALIAAHSLIGDAINDQARQEHIAAHALNVMSFGQAIACRTLRAQIAELPAHLLPADFVTRCVRILINDDRAAAEQFELTLGLPLYQDQHEQKAGLNPGQSTHTASVHQSISESALKLNARYKDALSIVNLQNTITELKAWIYDENNKPGSTDYLFKLTKAGLALDRLTNPTYHFLDAKSMVTTLQLLALVWVGIHDDQMRIGSLHDASLKMVTALYDVQRGYNLSENFVDDGKQNDRYICTSGTFNKIMEILWGIHRDVDIVFLTKELASHKMQVLTKQIVKDHHLAELEKECKNTEDKTKLSKLTEEIIATDLSLIWQAVMPRIQQAVFNEYGSLYKSIDDYEFVAMIEQAKHVDTGFLKSSNTPALPGHSTLFSRSSLGTEDRNPSNEPPTP